MYRLMKMLFKNLVSNKQAVLITGEDQGITALEFGWKMKLLLSLLSVLYEGSSSLRSEKRLIMDYACMLSTNGEKEHLYSGGIVDYLYKTWKNEGLLDAFFGRKEWMAGICKTVLYVVYDHTVRRSLLGQLSTSHKFIVELVDTSLYSLLSHPIEMMTLMKHRRDEKHYAGLQNTAQSKGLLSGLSIVSKEKGIFGLYHGFGLTLIENATSLGVRFGLNHVFDLAMTTLFRVDLVSENNKEKLSTEQRENYEWLQTVTVDLFHDILMAPLHFCVTRYVGDHQEHYATFKDCVVSINREEKWRTFFKGSWLGLFLARTK